MKKTGKVVHFEVPADNLERAKKFYRETFGWELEDYPNMEYVIARTVEVDEERMPMESGAINGGMMKKSDMVRGPSFAIAVEDIDEAMAEVKKGGGQMLTDKTPVGDMGFMAYFKDTEGNVLSLWQSAPKML